MILSSANRNDGRVIKESTEVLYGIDTVMNTVLRFLYQTMNKIDACVDYTRPSLAVDIEILNRAFLDAKKRGVKLRYVTEITKDNISYCKQMRTIVDELRHLDGIKGNFYISETGYLAPATFHEAGKPAAQIIYSNVKELIDHQKYTFLKPYGIKLFLRKREYVRLKKELKQNFMRLLLTMKKQARSLLI